jgi:hypothetical protein
VNGESCTAYCWDGGITPRPNGPPGPTLAPCSSLGMPPAYLFGGECTVTLRCTGGIGEVDFYGAPRQVLVNLAEDGGFATAAGGGSCFQFTNSMN